MTEKEMPWTSRHTGERTKPLRLYPYRPFVRFHFALFIGTEACRRDRFACDTGFAFFVPPILRNEGFDEIAAPFICHRAQSVGNLKYLFQVIGWRGGVGSGRAANW
jgi:hypothetical protein